MASPTPKRPLRHRKTMGATLQALAKYFVLKSREAARIVRKREPTENDIRTINRTLKLLYGAGLLHRIKLPNLDDDGAPYVYGLSDAGVRHCGEGKTFDDHSARTLDHELDISDFHIALQELCEAETITLHWRQSDLKHGVNPDAYFSTTRNGKANHFFLEVERAKMGNYRNGEPSIIRKLKHYYDYYNTPECEKAWGFKTFRIVTLVFTEERREHLLRAMRGELCHRMFWLGTMKSLAATFLTPKGDPFSFLDV